MSANTSGWQATTCPSCAAASSQSGCGSPTKLRQRDRAAQALVHAGVPGEQRVAVRRAVGQAPPDDLAAGRLQPDRELDRAADDRPHLRGEVLVAGDEQLVPDADRGIRGVIGLGGVLGVGAVGGADRPGAVRVLRLRQPRIGAPGLLVQAAGGERHRALDVVPRVDVPVRPADGAAGLLLGGDAAAGGQQLVSAEDAGYLRHPAARLCQIEAGAPAGQAAACAPSAAPVLAAAVLAAALGQAPSVSGARAAAGLVAYTTRLLPMAGFSALSAIRVTAGLRMMSQTSSL